MNEPGQTAYPCPFCNAETPGAYCIKCGRNRTAARRVCRSCAAMTPMAEPQCSHCGAPQRSELAVKIPLIIVIFVIGIALSIIIRLALG